MAARFHPPVAPVDQTVPVEVWFRPAPIPMYPPLPPGRNSKCLEERVYRYQGSSACVYPPPFTERVAGDAVECTRERVHVGNLF